MKYKFNLLIYPSVQILMFIASCIYLVKGMYVSTFFCLVFTSMFLSFSLHISYHYHVHHKPKSKLLDNVYNYIISILIGLPFHFYQIQHFTHHKYNNHPLDFTSTYKIVNEKWVAKSLFTYTLFWFLQVQGRKAFVEQATKLGYLNPKVRKKMILEGTLTLAAIGFLCLINFKFLLVYCAMIYLGWVFIALHNYGQHLPEEYANKIGYSYYGEIYNRLFLNNGLHFEHHDKPKIKYWDLKESKKEEAGKNMWIHLIDPVRLIFKRK